MVNLNRAIKLLKGSNLRFSYCRYSCGSSIWHNTIEDVRRVSVIKEERGTLPWLVKDIWLRGKMERRLVIKNSDGLRTIYLTILSKVLVGWVLLNFHIHKKLFGLINLTLKIFYAFILNQEALEVGYSSLTISNISYTLAELIIYLLSLIKRMPSWPAIRFLTNVALLLAITSKWTSTRTSTFALWSLIVPSAVLPTTATIRSISPVVIILAGRVDRSRLELGVELLYFSRA